MIAAESTLLTAYRKLTDFLTFAVNALPRKSDDVSSEPAEIEETVRRVIEDSPFDPALREIVGLLRTGALATHANELGEVTRKLFGTQLRLLNGVQSIADEAESKGVAVPSAGRLRDELLRVSRLREGMLEHWLPLDTGDAEEALAAYRRGECLTPEEMFAEILGVSQERLAEMTNERLRAQCGSDER